MVCCKAHHPLGNFVAATLETSKEILMNLIMTMIFMKIPLKFQVLLQQSCLVDGGLKLSLSSDMLVKAYSKPRVYWSSFYTPAGRQSPPAGVS